MISHDREFLNNTVDEIWEIDKETITQFPGNYDFYKGEKLRLIGKWDAEYKAFVKRKDKLEELLRLQRKIGKGIKGTKKRIKREIDNKQKLKYVKKNIKAVKFETGITHSKQMVKFNHVTKSYGKKNIFKNMNLDIRGGEKIWLFGPNGAGKSTLIKLIIGEELPTSGDVQIGNNMKVGYFAQNQVCLNYNKDIFTYFIEETGCYYEEAFRALKRFMFEKEDLRKKVKELSPGQRARFAFAIFASKDYDMLVLDEPDNHLDIETKEVLEKSLREYKGTLLLVSHDRFFIERIMIEKILNLKNGQLSTLSSSDLNIGE